MTHWTDSERRAELVKALRGVAMAPLVNVFRDPSGVDREKFAILAEALSEVEPDKWMAADHTNALKVAVRRALRLLPGDEESDPKYSPLSWREIGCVLYGFKDARDAESIGKPKAYDSRRQLVINRSHTWSTPTLDRRIFDPFFARFANEFATLKPFGAEESAQPIAPIPDDDDAAKLAEYILEHSSPAEIAAGSSDAVRVIIPHIRRRLEASVVRQKQAEQAAALEPDSPAAQRQLIRAERETKQQLAIVVAFRRALLLVSRTNARRLTEDVLWHDIDMAAAGRMSVEQLIEHLRDDYEFKEYQKD